MKKLGKLDDAISDPEFQPLHRMATDFCWHDNYGYRAEIVKPECYVDLAELFMANGFLDINYRHPQTGLTSLAAAVKRGNHPGIATYIRFLLDHGADLVSTEPDEQNPLAIAKSKNLNEIAKILMNAS